MNRMYSIVLLVLAFCSRQIDGQSGCRVMPSEKLENIAPACERDIGSCTSEPCEQCLPFAPKCCLPVTKRVLTTCDNSEVAYFKVKKCQCQPCHQGLIYVSGGVVNCLGKDNCDLGIEIGGVEITRTDGNGVFSFTVEYPENDRVVFSVVDSGDTYFMQVKVLDTVRNLQTYTTTVSLAEKSSTETFQSDEENSFAIDDQDSVYLVFPANAIIHTDGTAYTGSVNASINFVSPEDSDLIPAQLLTAGDPPGLLSSSGMFQIELLSEDGDLLFANGIQIFLDANALNLREIDGMGIWDLNAETGFWELFKTMTITNIDPSSPSGRRKRQTRGDWMSAEIDITSATPIRNLDVLVYPYCYIKARIFAGQVADPDNEVFVGTITTVYKRPGNVVANYLVGYVGFNGACLSVPCNADIIKTVLIGGDPGLTATSSSLPSQLDDLVTINITQDFEFIFQINDSALSITLANGPVYQYRSSCNSAPFSDYHLKFLIGIPENASTETNVIQIDENDFFGTWTKNLYAWWPTDTYFEACYIMVAVDSEEVKEVEIVSSGGNHSITAGNEYGLRSVRSYLPVICVEYKCPGPLSDSEYDRTVITVRPIYEFPQNITSYHNTELFGPEDIIHSGGGNFTAFVPETYGNGVYKAESNLHPLIAKESAMNLCYKNGFPVLIFRNDLGSDNQ